MATPEILPLKNGLEVSSNHTRKFINVTATYFLKDNFSLPKIIKNDRKELKKRRGKRKERKGVEGGSKKTGKNKQNKKVRDKKQKWAEKKKRKKEKGWEKGKKQERSNTSSSDSSLASDGTSDREVPCDVKSIDIMNIFDQYFLY
jgi:hypothetical protein